MPRRQRVVFLLLFCFGSFLNFGSSKSSNLFAQEYVPQEYIPYNGQSYELSQPVPYPTQGYYPQQSYPLESVAPVPTQVPQYQPPVYDSLPQDDYRIVPGVLLSETVEPQVDRQAFEQQETLKKTNEKLKLLEQDLESLRTDYDALLIEKQKLSSELDAKQAVMQASDETTAKQRDQLKVAGAQKKALESRIATLEDARDEARDRAEELKKQTSKLANENSTSAKKFKGEMAIAKKMRVELRNKNQELGEQIATLTKTNDALNKKTKVLDRLNV